MPTYKLKRDAFVGGLFRKAGEEVFIENEEHVPPKAELVSGGKSLLEQAKAAKAAPKTTVKVEDEDALLKGKA